MDHMNDVTLDRMLTRAKNDRDQEEVVFEPSLFEIPDLDLSLYRSVQQAFMASALFASLGYSFLL